MLNWKTCTARRRVRCMLSNVIACSTPCLKRYRWCVFRHKVRSEGRQAVGSKSSKAPSGPNQWPLRLRASIVPPHSKAAQRGLAGPEEGLGREAQHTGTCCNGRGRVAATCGRPPHAQTRVHEGRERESPEGQRPQPRLMADQPGPGAGVFTIDVQRQGQYSAKTTTERGAAVTGHSLRDEPDDCCWPPSRRSPGAQA